MMDYMEIEEEDEIEREIDVFLTTKASNNLYFVQYPLRPPDKPYEETPQASFQVKPQVLKMVYNVEDEEDSDKKIAYTLSSTKQPMLTSYSIAVLRGNELHITPMKPQTTEVVTVDQPFLAPKPPSSGLLNNNNPIETPIEPETKTIYKGGAILQMRPNLGHLNSSLNENNDEEEEDVKNTANGKEEFTAVKATFQKRESEWAANTRKKIAAYNSLFKSDEPFIPLSHFHANTFQSQETLETLIYGESSEMPSDINFNVENKSYVSLIVPPITLSNQKDPPPILSSTARTYLTFLKSLEELFKSAEILTFELVKKHLSCKEKEEYSTADLLKALEGMCVLVFGIWVYKSELKYKKGEDKLVKARNLALYLLNEKGYIKCSELAQYLRHLLVDEIDQILNPLCNVQFHSDQSRIWILKYWNEAENFEFLSLNDKVSENSRSYWAKQKMIIAKQFRNVIKANHSSHSAPSSAPASVDSLLKDFFMETFTKFGVCSIPFLKQKLAEKIDSNLEKFGVLSGIKDEHFRNILKEIAMSIQQTYFLKSIPNDKDINLYRDVIISVFQNKPDRCIKKSEIIAASKEMIGQPIPVNYYNRILKELSVSRGSTWQLRSGNGND